jgi:hypothetical protein
MHMIRHAADDQRLTIEVGEDSTHVAMQFFSQFGVSQERSPALRGKHRVHDDFG